MRIIRVADVGFSVAARALRRTKLQDNPEVESTVRSIIAKVAAEGDSALLELGRKFDSPNLDSLEVTDEEWDAACANIDQGLKETVLLAAANITAFHERQKRTSWLDMEQGVVTGQMLRPLQRVGVYVPGGRAVYPSSVLMCALPAKVAGVEDLIMCSPVRSDGTLHPLVLFAARTAGVKRVFKVGGAQAVAAMAIGTVTVPVVDKIVGPGNTYVNIAKKQLWGVVDIDMLAGPSEVCVIADSGANPSFAAADMLTQAEHDPDCAAYLITDSESVALAVVEELDKQIELLPRKAILQQALAELGGIIIAENLVQACELANICAPEHLALMVRDPFAYLGSIRSAGAILMGDYSPQTLGDYFAGPSHTLPTSGTARFASPLNVDTFMKKSSFIYYTSTAITAVAPRLIQFAETEGFEAHAEAVHKRVQMP